MSHKSSFAGKTILFCWFQPARNRSWSGCWLISWQEIQPSSSNRKESRPPWAAASWPSIGSVMCFFQARAPWVKSMQYLKPIKTYSFTSLIPKNQWVHQVSCCHNSTWLVKLVDFSSFFDKNGPHGAQKLPKSCRDSAPPARRRTRSGGEPPFFAEKFGQKNSGGFPGWPSWGWHVFMGPVVPVPRQSTPPKIWTAVLCTQVDAIIFAIQRSCSSKSLKEGDT